MHVWVRPLLYHERAEYPGRVAAAGRMQRERGTIAILPKVTLKKKNRPNPSENRTERFLPPII